MLIVESFVGNSMEQCCLWAAGAMERIQLWLFATVASETRYDDAGIDKCDSDFYAYPCKPSYL